MITLQGMRLSQRGYTLYLTSATVEELKSWFESDRIYPDIWKRDKPEGGYQRLPDKQRVTKIAEYLERKLQIEETLLPNTVILNIRQKGMVGFDALKKSDSKSPIELGTIRVYDEALPFYEVDGQHRVRGLIEAYKDMKERKSKDFEEIRSYPVPLTIMEGLDRPTEAMQFVVINNTQRKVDPALVLRILYKRYRDKGEKLEFFLKGQLWRLHAVDICDQLNCDTNSPWCDKIIAPGDNRKGRVVSEQNFISSLETVYPKLEPNIDIVRTYLPLYWRAIAGLWKECVGDNAANYSLQRGSGVTIFHWLFPFVYFKAVSLSNVKLQGFMEILKPVSKRFPPSFWQRGGEAKKYTSKGSQRELVDMMIGCTLPGKQFRLSKFKGITGSDAERVWDIASKLLPLRLYHLFTSDKVNNIDAVATGVYTFYSFTKKKFYVGRSEKAGLKTRLQNHLQKKNENEFHIFNHRLCKEPKEAHDLECALYHLLPENLRINKEHPRALEGRGCPFCVT
jgi:DGQHR domain-containing protein